MVEALSSSSPPYSSGASIINSPSSPHFFIPSTTRSKFCLSISSICGTISFATNCSVVSPICRCSSVKSSGVKTSSQGVSAIRYSPPLSIFSAILVTLLLNILDFLYAAMVPMWHMGTSSTASMLANCSAVLQMCTSRLEHYSTPM